MYFIVIIFAISTITAQECFDDGNEFCIDQNDILSVDLLPGSFLFADQHQNDNTSNVTVQEDIADGSFNQALDEMDYHRWLYNVKIIRYLLYKTDPSVLVKDEEIYT